MTTITIVYLIVMEVIGPTYHVQLTLGVYPIMEIVAKLVAEELKQER
jgi:hypothetical protein